MELKSFGNMYYEDYNGQTLIYPETQVRWEWKSNKSNRWYAFEYKDSVRIVLIRSTKSVGLCNLAPSNKTAWSSKSWLILSKDLFFFISFILRMIAWDGFISKIGFISWP